MEVVSNLRPSKFLAECSTQPQSTLKLRRTFSQITTQVTSGKWGECSTESASSIECWEQGKNLRVGTAPSAEDARPQMKIGHAPFITETNLLLENEPACGNCVEHSPQFFG